MQTNIRIVDGAFPRACQEIRFRQITFLFFIFPIPARIHGSYFVLPALAPFNHDQGRSGLHTLRKSRSQATETL